MKKLILCVIVIFLAGCTDPDTAKVTLTKAGFTDIQTNGYAFFACGDDIFHTQFIAKNVQGMTVSGVVCNGFFKRGTIRF
jgi:uncharacterized lipoprotein YajG